MPDDVPSGIWLSSVRAERFKAAFKPRIVPLQPFNVIIGRNGSGKSTLLEVIQWLDTAIRRDAREACDRYFGISDIINLRSRTAVPYFQLDLDWVSSLGDNDLEAMHYSARVEDREGIPHVAGEQMTVRTQSGRTEALISTSDHGERWIEPVNQGDAGVRIVDPDRLAIARLGDTRFLDPIVSSVTRFWADAVFLRLSPSRLAEGSSSVRRSFDPILDEEGQQLPALLSELSPEQRMVLAEDIQEILPGIRGVRVVETGVGRDRRVNYDLLERMPYRGRAGRWQFPIPAWMLSEGTRRITALLALLVREPAPSLLCVEEIENGLDPWAVQLVLHRLQEARYRGTQVILTTHSPWLLDHVPLESVLYVQRKEGDTEYMRFDELREVGQFDPSLPAGTRYVNLELGHS